MKRKILVLTLAIVLVCTTSAIFLVGCGGSTPSASVPAKKDVATTYVALDINPSIEMILDENNKVMSVSAKNKDANVLLHGEEGIIGADVNVAVEKIGQLSAKMGYVNENNKVINVNMSTSLSTSAGSKLEADIKASVKKGAEDESKVDGGTGIEISITVDGDYSLRREYEAFKKEHPEVKDIAEYRLIVEAMANDARLSVEEAIAMSKAELLEIIEEAREDANEALMDLLPKAERATMEALENAYEYALERLETMSYLVVDVKNDPIGTLANLSRMDNHIRYIVNENIAITLEDINEAIEISQKKLDEVLTDAEVEAIFNVLVEKGVVTSDQLANEKKLAQDENGVYTFDSVEDYLDIKLKNVMDETEDALETALDTVMDDIDDRLEQIESVIPEEVKTRLANITNEVRDKIYEAIGVDNIIGVEDLAVVKNKINDVINEIIGLDTANITIEYLEKLEEDSEDKAEMYEEKIVEAMGKTKGLLDKVEKYEYSLRNNEKVLAKKAEFERVLHEKTASILESIAQEKADKLAKNTVQ